MKHWGIDLGGTKTEIAVIENGRVLRRRRVPTRPQEGYEALLSNISSLVAETSKDIGTAPQLIGIGTPGSVDPSSDLIRNSNTTCLNGRPLAADLTQMLRAEVRLANDANCFALAESRWGAGKSTPSAESVLGLIVGTGVGAGLVIGGRLIVGANGNAGEWGHNPMAGEDRPCYCGRRGCVETVISGPALESYYQEITGVRRSLGEIFELRHEDSAASATVERLLSRFGRAIAAVINILDPSLIILGGGVGNIDLLYDRWPEYALPHIFNGGSASTQTKLLKPLLGDSSGVFGAAALTGNFDLEEFAT